MPDTRPPAPIIGVYVIYSVDILGTAREIDAMNPTLSSGPYPVPTFPELIQTEGDEQYDYGYLGEGGDPSYFPAGTLDMEGLQECPDADDCPPGHEPAPCGEGRHRKWAGKLTIDRWRELADRYIIDLDPDGVPERYEETMGSLTEFGRLDAVAVDDSEGWSPTRVIQSQFYVSFALAPDAVPAD